jgi:rhodanese-related sulfurtransferase
MDHLIQFIGHNWLLCGAFLAVLTAIVLVEGQDAGATGGLRLLPQAVTQLINRESAVVIDLQEVDAFREGHIVGAKNMPLSTWSEAQPKLKKYQSKPLVLVDQQGQKSARCARELQKAGFTQVHCLAGGLDAWRSAKLPLVRGNK